MNKLLSTLRIGGILVLINSGSEAITFSIDKAARIRPISTININDQLKHIRHTEEDIFLEPGQSRSISIAGAVDDIKQSLDQNQSDQINFYLSDRRGLGGYSCPPLQVNKETNVQELDRTEFVIKYTENRELKCVKQ